MWFPPETATDTQKHKQTHKQTHVSAYTNLRSLPNTVLKWAPGEWTGLVHGWLRVSKGTELDKESLVTTVTLQYYSYNNYLCLFGNSLDPRPKTNPRADRFQYRTHFLRVILKAIYPPDDVWGRDKFGDYYNVVIEAKWESGNVATFRLLVLKKDSVGISSNKWVAKEFLSLHSNVLPHLTNRRLWNMDSYILHSGRPYGVHLRGVHCLCLWTLTLATNLEPLLAASTTDGGEKN